MNALIQHSRRFSIKFPSGRIKSNLDEESLMCEIVLYLISERRISCRELNAKLSTSVWGNALITSSRIANNAYIKIPQLPQISILKNPSKDQLRCLFDIAKKNGLDIGGGQTNE